MTVTTAAKFIPKLWSDEVIATYKANLVAANLVRNLNHVGKKGDTIHIPTPGRNAASAKVKDTAVPFICILSPILTLLTNYTTINYFEFDFEFFVLVLNGAYTFIGLVLFKKNTNHQ